MNLEFKILWIEDNWSSVSVKSKKINRYLLDKGFETDNNIKVVNSIEEFENDIGYGNTKDYDLLLIDLNLGDEDSEKDGDAIIRKIREEEHIYTEIIFYSSEYQSLQEKIREHFLEGVFTAKRDDLVDKVNRIIDVIIKKVQDVNNLRGLIMAEVAELDRIKEKIIIKATSAEIEFNIKEYILKTLQKSYRDNLKKVEKYKENDIATILENLYVDSDKKARSINKFENSFDEKAYRKSILSIRNKFAHIEECDGVDKDGNACKMIGDIEFTENECIRIRRDIKSNKKTLEDILQQLNA